MIKQLEDIVKLWYLRNGYYNGKNEWFVINTSSGYKRKRLEIVDLTGKTPSAKYTFMNTDSNRIVSEAINYFNGELMLKAEDFKEIWNILNEAIISLDKGDKTN